MSQVLLDSAFPQQSQDSYKSFVELILMLAFLKRVHLHQSLDPRAFTTLFLPYCKYCKCIIVIQLMIASSILIQRFTNLQPMLRCLVRYRRMVLKVPLGARDSLALPQARLFNQLNITVEIHWSAPTLLNLAFYRSYQLLPLSPLKLDPRVLQEYTVVAITALQHQALQTA